MLEEFKDHATKFSNNGLENNLVLFNNSHGMQIHSLIDFFPENPYLKSEGWYGKISQCYMALEDFGRINLGSLSGYILDKKSHFFMFS